DGQYELHSQPTGLCLILTNGHFGDGDVRHGTDKDAESLAEVFSSLGFRVLMCKDQTKDQMERALECFASQCDLSQLQEFMVKEWTRSGFTDLLEAPQHGDAFICCVLSHGNKGGVLGIDGQSLPIKLIERTFMATPQSPLTAKPKVFLIQACQGRQIHPGVLLNDLQADGSHSIPKEADLFFQYADVEDHIALRDPTEGSWFIQSVCEQLKVGCERNEEIEVILRRVNNEVAGKEGDLRRGPVKQMPEIRHTLRKGLVLTPHRISDQLERSQPVKKLKTRDSQDGKALWEKSIFDLKSSGILETEAIVGKVVKKSELLTSKKGTTASVKLMVYGKDLHRQIKEGSSYIFRNLIQDGKYVKVNASSSVSETKPVNVPEEFEREAERLVCPESPLTSIKDIKSSPPQTHVSVEGTVTEIDPVQKVKVKEKMTNQQKFEATKQSKDLSVGDVLLLRT
ncbi:Caspase-8, partial [Dissostichus eleginoides]